MIVHVPGKVKSHASASSEGFLTRFAAQSSSFAEQSGQLSTFASADTSLA
jgi:hypothetical protein